MYRNALTAASRCCLLAAALFSSTTACDSLKPTSPTTRAVHLTREQYFAEFEKEWNSLRGELIKVETLQTYAEDWETPSYKVFLAQGRDAARPIVESELASQENALRDLKNRQASLSRIRLVHRPVNEYTQWEWLVYAQLSKFGVQITAIDDTTALTFSEGVECKGDFLVLGDYRAYCLDMTDDGRLLGAWRIEDRSTIQRLRRYAADLARHGRRWDEYHL